MHAAGGGQEIFRLASSLGPRACAGGQAGACLPTATPRAAAGHAVSAVALKQTHVRDPSRTDCQGRRSLK